MCASMTFNESLKANVCLLFTSSSCVPAAAAADELLSDIRAARTSPAARRCSSSSYRFRWRPTNFCLYPHRDYCSLRKWNRHGGWRRKWSFKTAVEGDCMLSAEAVDRISSWIPIMIVFQTAGTMMSSPIQF